MAKSAEQAAAPAYVIRRSKIQGRGGYAARAIKKGERIVEYLGQRISWAEADRRYDDTKVKRHHTFLFTVNNRTIIDAAFDGNDARFLNHSCDPNCEAIIEKSRVFIHAMKDIRKGAELLYDYSYARDKNTTEEDEKLYKCLCGSKSCRGTILEAPKKKKKVSAHHTASRHTAKKQKKTKGDGRKSGSSARR